MRLCDGLNINKTSHIEGGQVQIFLILKIELETYNL